jgi:hypothetical protein
MLYETTARASEIVAINAEDLNLEQRRAPVRSQGDDSCTSVRRRAVTGPERPDLERDNYGRHPPDARAYRRECALRSGRGPITSCERTWQVAGFPTLDAI